MPDVELQFSIGEVKRAGKILRDQEPGSKDYGDALEVFQNWRNCHSVPLNQFYDSLQEHVRTESRLTYVVNRPKRIEAVIKKLQRDRPTAQLSTMQDIAGCRAIVKSIDHVDPFVEACKQMWSQHTLREEYQYIDKPNQKTGYRGVHLVFAFQSEHKAFNGRLIEVQIRTREQHAWATAVETVDLIQKQSLKSGHGDPRWQRFFCLMGSVIAYMESKPFVPNTPLGYRELKNELRRYADDLQVGHHFQAYGATARVIQRNHEVITEHEKSKGKFQLFLIDLNLDTKRLSVKGYSEPQIEQAYKDVANAENAGKNVVLAGAHDFFQLKEAYPNWFIDAHNFLMILQRTLGEDVDLFV